MGRPPGTGVNAIRRLSLLVAVILGTVCGCAGTVWHASDQTQQSPAQSYLSFVSRACDRVAVDMDEITRVAELAAERHIAGGLLAFPWNGQGLQDELWGRSGGLMHIGFGRSFKKDRTEEERKQDVVLINWQREKFPDNLSKLTSMKGGGMYIIGFGPRALPELAVQRPVEKRGRRQAPRSAPAGLVRLP